MQQTGNIFPKQPISDLQKSIDFILLVYDKTELRTTLEEFLKNNLFEILQLADGDPKPEVQRSLDLFSLLCKFIDTMKESNFIATDNHLN